MLLNVSGVVVPWGKVPLQVFLDIVPHSQSFDQVENSQCVVLPVCCFGHGQVVCPTNLVQVDKLVGMLDDSQAGRRVQRGLEANPREYTRLVKLFQGGDAVARKLSSSLPFSAKVVVQAGKRGRKGIPALAEHAEKWQRSAATFRQRADAQSVRLKRFNSGPCQRCVERVEGVCGKTEHHLFGDSSRPIFGCVFAQRFEKSGARGGPSIKFRAIHSEHLGDVAVGTCVPTSPVRVRGEFGIFASLSPRGINIRASSDAPAICIDGHESSC